VRLPTGLPVGYAVRLYDDVRGGEVVMGGPRTSVARLSPTARALLAGRELTVTGPSEAALVERLLDLDLAGPVVDRLPLVSTDQLTVVVPVKDRSVELAGLTGLDVLVVDDASLDPGAVASVAARHGARLHRLPVNLGPAGARNAGLAQVTTPYVAFVDSDVTVSAEQLVRLARHLADPLTALVAPRVRGVSREPHPAWFARYDVVASALDLGPLGACARPGSSVSYVPSACLVGRVADLGDGFDERLRSGEDVDLVWRLVAAGRRVRYDADVCVGHAVRTDLGAWLGRSALYGSSAAPLADRHGTAVAPAVWSAPTAVATLALLAERRWSVPVALGCVAVLRRELFRTFPETPDRPQHVRRVLARTAVGTARQTSGLLLRHWLPLTLAAAPFSRRVRRAAVVAALVEGVVEARTRGALGDLPAFLAARRTNDAGYAVGLWVGVVRARSIRALVPVWRPAVTRARPR
jgi:mycofactocin system glycosyltransferase